MKFNTRNIQRLSQKALSPFLALSIMGYFIYHSIQGDRGILAWAQLQKHLLHTQTQLEELIKERQNLEEKVQALGPQINRDLLDQQARLQLGYTHPDEIVILRLDKTAQK